MQRLVCTTNQYQRQLQTCLKCTHPHHDPASRCVKRHHSRILGMFMGVTSCPKRMFSLCSYFQVYKPKTQVWVHIWLWFFIWRKVSYYRVSSIHVFREGREPREKPMGAGALLLWSVLDTSRGKWKKVETEAWESRRDRDEDGGRGRGRGGCCGGQRHGRKAEHPRQLSPVCQSLLQPCFGA